MVTSCRSVALALWLLAATCGASSAEEFVALQLRSDEHDEHQPGATSKAHATNVLTDHDNTGMNRERIEEKVDAYYGAILDEAQYEKERVDEKNKAALKAKQEKRLAKKKAAEKKKREKEEQRRIAEEEEAKKIPFTSSNGKVLHDADWGIDWMKVSAQRWSKTGEPEMVSTSSEESSSYEAVLKSEGVSDGQTKQCTLPEGVLRNLLQSEEHGQAKFGMQSLMEFMDEPTRKPFTYMRWGPDEWECALGLNTKTRKETKTEEAICDQLMEDFQDLGNAPSRYNVKADNFFLGVGTDFLCKESNLKLHSNIKRFFADDVLNPKFKGFMDSYYFPLVPAKEIARMYKDRPAPLLFRRKVVVVGPSYTEKLVGLTGHVGHITLKLDLLRMPTTTYLWQEYGEIIAQMREASDSYPFDNVVFLFAGDVASKSLIYRAYRNLGHKDTIIDVGSSLDLFAGKEGEGWARDLRMACQDYPQYEAPDVCLEFAKRNAYRKANAAA